MAKYPNKSAAAKKRYEDADERKKSSDRMKKSWADPEYRKAQLTSMEPVWAGTAKRNTTHGMSKSPEYKVWDAMIGRCTRKTASWYRYGGRGITVHPEWMGRGGFAKFIEYIGPRPTDGHTVDRIDNDGNYEPGNVRWADRQTQSDNSTKVRQVTINNETHSLAEWARRIGVRPPTLAGRIARGWSDERLLQPPSGGRPRLIRQTV